MSRAVADLPENVESLRAIIAAQAIELADQARRLHTRDTLIEKLKAQLAALRRARFGASSEKVERTIEQLELALEDIEAAAVETAPLPAKAEEAKNRPARQPLPDHLPRHEEVHEVQDCACPTCGGRDFLKAGSVVSEVLDYVPASFRVVRHVQRKIVCKGCDTEIKAAMPSPPIERGKPGPASSPMCSSPNIATTCRSTASRKFTRAKASICPARQWPIGSAGRARCWRRSSTPCAPTSSPAIAFTATTVFSAGARQGKDQDRQVMDLCARRASLG